MTASSPSGVRAASTALHDNATKSRLPASNQAAATTSSGPSFSSSAAFQQVKQTQASLARLSRVHQLHQAQQQQQQGGQNQSSQQQQQAVVAKSAQPAAASSSSSSSSDAAGQQLQKPTTFVDCLIRRFKNCFSEDSCMVPMFVVGNLSPGSDGTHLILPPCVSLGRQNINRFSSPKNLRLMNSIRESCRSIEELDLGDNKLTDLIEVYKILQYTPNLRFLNLSENDLSRTSPVAMASSSASSSSSSSSSSFAGHQHFSPGSGQQQVALPQATLQATTTPPSHQHMSSSSGQLSPGQRSCLAPINQNQQQHSSAMVSRRHSTLGQSTSAAVSAAAAAATVSAASMSGSTSSNQLNRSHLSTSSHRHQVPTRPRTSTSRIAEARRMAAANALAQSKKTSSSVASKLANSAAASDSLARHSTSARRTRESAGAAAATATSSTSQDSSSNITSSHKQTRAGAGPSQRFQIGPASTMHLARSLSSLSAKDLRAASSSSSRFGAAHRASGTLRGVDSTRAGALAKGHRASIESMRQINLGTDVTKQSATTKITTSTSHQKLYVEPIVESEDVDMGAEQQVSPTGGQVAGSGGATQAAGSGSHQASTTPTTRVPSSTHTGNQTNTAATSSTTTTTTTTTTLRSVCNTNSGLLATVGAGGGQAAAATNFRRTFESIKALALNNTGCQWKVVCSILSRMPNLEELHLSLNNYERIDLEPNEFKHLALKRLYLCNNPKLTNWEELDKLLAAFPSLQALSIADCNISQIPDNLDRAREWRKLCGLNINGWPIKEWPVVERLNQLPSLIDLRCRNLDVLENIDEPRHHLIARLPKLQRLNGSEIEEREHAEKAFLRFFMVNSHLERPPRFHELMQVYGDVPQHVDVDVDLSPPSQASVRVIYLNRNYYRKGNEDDVLMSEDFLQRLMDNVHVANNVVVQDADNSNNSLQENMDVADNISTSLADNAGASGPVRLFKDAGQEVVALEVDLRQSVRKFKSTIASLFGLNSQNLILYYIDHEMVGLMGPEQIKHNQKKLWNYNVQDGDQFIVEDQ